MPIAPHIQDDLTRSSWIRKMFETGLVLKQKYGAQNVYDFSLGNPDLPAPPAFEHALQEEARRSGPFVHGYMSNLGYPETRAAVAQQLAAETGLPFTPQLVIMTCGAAGAINTFLKAMLSPGDEVVVIAPYFAEYTFYISNHQGLKVVTPSTAALLPDLTRLKKLLTPRTRVLLINTPNNPSGRVYDAALLTELGALLDDHRNQSGQTIYLLADSPYQKIIYDGLAWVSPLNHYPHTVLATSFSKDLSLAGERIGYLAVHPAAADAADIINAAAFCNRVLGYINAPALMQRVICRCLSASVDVSVYQQRRDRLYTALTGMGYRIIKPEGTFYIFPETPIADDIQFVRELQEERILTTPGAGFDCPGHFRISYTVSDDTIERALPGFERVIRQYQS